MGDNTEMGTLAVNEELHAKQQEAARAVIDKTAERVGTVIAISGATGAGE